MYSNIFNKYNCKNVTKNRKWCSDSCVTKIATERAIAENSGIVGKGFERKKIKCTTQNS